MTPRVVPSTTLTPLPGSSFGHPGGWLRSLVALASVVLRLLARAEAEAWSSPENETLEKMRNASLLAVNARGPQRGRQSNLTQARSGATSSFLKKKSEREREKERKKEGRKERRNEKRKKRRNNQRKKEIKILRPESNCKRCALPARPSRARGVCGSASSRAGQVAIQAWTGSGVVGPLDVMGPQESPRQGQGNAQDHWFV